MSNSILRDKSKEFAKQIVILCRNIKANHKESVLTNQLLRSGTSIGANIHEAQYAQGTKDFISKLEIAQKRMLWNRILDGITLWNRIYPRKCLQALAKSMRTDTKNVNFFAQYNEGKSRQ